MSRRVRGSNLDTETQATPDSLILRRLRGAGDDYLPGSDLGDPSAVATRISVLRAAGYEIEDHPRRGYRLLSAPDRLIADDILSRIPECQWIRRILVFQSTSSTNDLVAAIARDGAPEGVVVFAEEHCWPWPPWPPLARRPAPRALVFAPPPPENAPGAMASPHLLDRLGRSPRYSPIYGRSPSPDRPGDQA